MRLGKILGYFFMFSLFSFMISFIMVVLFADMAVLKKPLLMLDYYLNISTTYPITVYPFLFFMLIMTVVLIYQNLSNDAEYGDAQFASNYEINKMHDNGLYEPTGTILGLRDHRFIRTNASLSTLIVAPQGTGKTAAIIIPTLLSDTSSFIINDIKGELWDKTSKQRSNFGNVGIFAPSKNLTGALRWNPFDEKCLPHSWEDKISFVDRIGSILYPTEQAGLDSTSKHFNAEAKSIFLFFSLYLIYKKGHTSLPDIFSISLETDDVQGTVALTLEEEGEDLPLILRQNGNRILQKEGKEFGASLTTFTQALEPFSRPTIARNLSRCDFNHRDFRQDKPFSLYIFIPANDVSRMAPIIRMLIEYLVDEFLSDNDQEVIKRQRVVFAMDEYPRMGYMEKLKEAPALQRSYNMATIFVAQDKNQLETTYGKGSFDQFLTTTDFKVIFRQNEDTTAARFSNLVGKTTRNRKSVSQKDLELLGTSSINKEGVPLILPQDFLNQKKNDLYILISGSYERPIKAKCAWWFKDKNMQKLIGAKDDIFVSDLEYQPSEFEANDSDMTNIVDANSNNSFDLDDSKSENVELTTTKNTDNIEIVDDSMSLDNESQVLDIQSDDNQHIDNNSELDF